MAGGTSPLALLSWDLDPSVGLGVDMTASHTRGLVLVQRDKPYAPSLSAAGAVSEPAIPTTHSLTPGGLSTGGSRGCVIPDTPAL